MDLLTAIPVSRPSFFGNEHAYVLDALTRMELSAGRYTQWLEQAFASFCESQYAMTCCNGTAGLHLALIAVGIKSGDEVLMPALTYVATANAVRYCGATPVFCDVDPDTWCLDPADVRRKMTSYTRAMMPVHLYGVPCEMQELSNISIEYGIALIEDAAEAHGATYRGQRVGSLGDLGVFSFFGNKMLTCGEGGMVVTDSVDYADRVRLYRGQGASSTQRYYHTVVGHNYRLTNLQSAIALAQLETFEEHAVAHHRVVAAYRAATTRFEQQRIPAESVSSDWMFSLLMPKGVDRDEVARKLALQGIDTRPVFVSMTELPMYSSRDISCPISEDISRRGLSLPTYAELTGGDIQRVCAALDAATL